MAIQQNGPSTEIYTTSVCLVPFIKYQPTVVGYPFLGEGADIVAEDTLKIKLFSQESRKIFILVFLVLFPLIASSQRKSDIGIFAGTSYYMGDLNPSKHFYLPGIAIGPMFRYNFEPRNSIRFSAIYHGLNGDTNKYGDPYVESLYADFNATFVDAAANYEINFIPYKTANRKLNQSLYLSAGLGYHIVITSSVPSAKNHFTIPFGIGYKFNAAKRLSAGVELSIRKTFTDEAIDGTTNIASESNKALFGNKDWYTFAGIFISYKIFSYRDDCPTYD
jgi:hypothetical protein